MLVFVNARVLCSTLSGVLQDCCSASLYAEEAVHVTTLSLGKLAKLVDCGGPADGEAAHVVCKSYTKGKYTKEELQQVGSSSFCT